MKYSASQVENALQEWIQKQPKVSDMRYNYKTSKYDIPHEENFQFDWYGDGNKVIELEEIGTLEFVETTPEDPGDGKWMGSIWKLNDQYFCQDGYYSSWDSSEFDGAFREVKQKEVKVIRWVDING